MGHAGAIISGGAGTATSKIEKLTAVRARTLAPLHPRTRAPPSTRAPAHTPTRACAVGSVSWWLGRWRSLVASVPRAKERDGRSVWRACGAHAQREERFGAGEQGGGRGWGASARQRPLRLRSGSLGDGAGSGVLGFLAGVRIDSSANALTAIGRLVLD
eukprot:6174812-Pleurochrysis_carterae.AAC.3